MSGGGATLTAQQFCNWIKKIVLWETLSKFPTLVASSDSYNYLTTGHSGVKMKPDPLLFTICITLCLFGNCQGGRGGGGGGSGGGTVISR